MRLKSVYLKKYKNLKNFDIHFDNNSYVDILVGRNGTGKSNFFEATLKILKSFIYSDFKNIITDYKFVFEDKGNIFAFENKVKKMYLNGNLISTMPIEAMPKNIAIYYAGHNKGIQDLLTEYEEKHIKDMKGDEIRINRPFVGLSQGYKKVLILILLSLSKRDPIKIDLLNKLNVDKLDDEIKIVFKKPSFGNKIIDWVENPYWNTKGYLKTFLGELESIKSAKVHDDKFDVKNQEYILFINSKKFSKLVKRIDSIEVFKLFDDLRLLGMIKLIDYSVTNKSKETIKIDDFQLSDGEMQIMSIESIIDWVAEENGLLMLDEPDAFLHPKWQFELVKRIAEKADEKKCHVVINSHCPSTLVSSKDKTINLFEFRNKAIVSSAISKREAISRLTEGLVALTEDESALRINNVLKNTNKSIVFVEGITDVIILETAYKKLKNTNELPFLIQDLCGCGNIKVTMKNGQLFTKYADKTFFALFDFDEAYEEWREIGGVLEQNDPHKCLCRKLGTNKGYSMLIPVPDNELKIQVIDPNNPVELVVETPILSIEHLFWDNARLKSNFERNAKNGRDAIRFKGDKISFAEKKIASLNAEDFIPFTPIFDFIESKI